MSPPNADDVRAVVEERLAALDGSNGVQEAVTVEWRGTQRPLQVISMPVALLSYNPETHRVRAQRSLDPARDRELTDRPFGQAGQDYLHDLLRGDPADPTRIDPSFVTLMEDIKEHGQTDPGVITRAGVIINGNTRRAALKVLGQPDIRVGVLPSDAAHGDTQSIELSLQLRKDLKRDYSFMNSLLALDEQVAAGRSAADIQAEFRMRPATFERCRWILDFVREAIDRSRVPGTAGQQLAMRLVDFESDQGKLEELHKTYGTLKPKSPDEADMLREQRLLAIALGKSKTDVRLIDPGFTDRYMAGILPAGPTGPAPGVYIPGTSITAAAPSQKVEALRALTNEVLRAKAVELSPGPATTEELAQATATLTKLDTSLDKALDQAGKQARVIKKRFAAVDRLSDANDDLALSVAAVADARATGTFDADDLDEVLLAMKANLGKLAQIITRGPHNGGDGVAWLRAASTATLPGPAN